MALALYRKYRPRTFAEVIGQEHVTEPLSQALRSGRLYHAYLFSGPRGCGKTSSARILARSLNCEQGPTPEPCGVCASCRSLANDGGGSIDVIEIDAASHGGVDDARELREKAFFAPASSRFKIYVIDEAHMVSPAGFNALLKLVEEPPDYVKFIFATTEPEKVLGTIRSRTHHYPFRLIPPAVLRPYLQQLTEAEGVHVEPAVLPLVVKAGGGSARDTLSVLDQLISGAGPEGVSYTRAVALLGVTDVALIDEMCDALAAGDGAAAYATIDRVAEAGHDPRRFASDLLERLRDLIVLQQVPDALTKGLIDGPADQLDAMTAQATRLGPATLSRCADIVHTGLVDMRGTTAPRLLLELITARMLLPGAEDSTGALLQRLERMERRLTLTADQDQTVSVRPEHPTVRPESVPSAGEAPPGSGSAGGLSAARAAAAAASRRAPGAAETPAPVNGGSASASGPAVGPAPPAESAPAAPPAPVASAPSVAAGSPASVPVATDRSVPVAAPRPADRGAAEEWPEEEDPGPYSEFEDVEPPDPGFADEGAGPQNGRSSARPPQGHADPARRDAGVSPERPHRRAEPAGVMPDAPEEPSVEPAPTGQLSAAAIREVWPEIMTTVSRKSRKIAALAQGATVRELEGQTVVLTFRFPAHAKMVAAEPALISDALYEALGGRWQIRCDVASEAGPSQGSPDRSAGARGGTPANGTTPENPGSPAGRSVHDSEGPSASRSARESGSTPARRSAQAGAAARSAPGSASLQSVDESAAPRSAREGGDPPASGSTQTSAGPAASGSSRGSGRPPASRAAREGAGPASRGTNAAPAQSRSGPSGPGARREPAPTAPAHDDGDDWPEPARIGGSNVSAEEPLAEESPAEEEDWPEHAIPGGGVPAGRSDAAPAGGRTGGSKHSTGPYTGSAPAGTVSGAGSGPGGAGSGSDSTASASAGLAGAGSSPGGAGSGSGGAGPGPAGGISSGPGSAGSASAVKVGVGSSPSGEGPGGAGPGGAGPGGAGPGGAGPGGAGPGGAGPGGAGPGLGGAGSGSAGGIGTGSSPGGAGSGGTGSIAAGSTVTEGSAATMSSIAVAGGTAAGERPEAGRGGAARAGFGSTTTGDPGTGRPHDGAKDGHSGARNAGPGAAAAPGRQTTPARPAGSSGLAAARAAAANAGRSGAAAPASATPAESSSDGSSAPNEPPFDPDHDGPLKGGAYEGFDPGDEPLDDVIDEKTARQSSEQQAMQLLQDAFGAEKISEI